jgi:hypothetical protein
VIKIMKRKPKTAQSWNILAKNLKNEVIMEIHKYYSAMKCKWIKYKREISGINGTLMSEK